MRVEMKIESPRAMQVGDRRRIEAEVVFEDTDRPPLLAYIEAGPPLADALEPLPEAFVLPAVPAAAWMGEKRLRIEGALDPTLAAGLEQIMTLLGAWYEHCHHVAIEPTDGLRALIPAPRPHAAMLCSGGVDALALLAENRRTFPLEHPGAIRTAAYLYGYTAYEFSDGARVPERVAAYEKNARRLEGLGEKLGFELARVETNAALLFPDTAAWMDAGHTAGLLAPLVASQKRVTDAWIGSTGVGLDHVPHASHPMLDPLYSTSAVDVRLGQPLVTRHAKIGQLATWEPAYDVVHPCHHNLDLPDGQVNCGACDKCVRTMLSLVAWGALERFGAFPADDVTPELLARAEPNRRYAFMEQPDVLDQLRAIGRLDLVAAVEAQAERRAESRGARRRRRWLQAVRQRLGRASEG